MQRSSSTSLLVCFSAALFPFFDFVQMNMFNAVSVPFMQAFHLDAKHLGLMSALYLYSSVIVIFPVGILLDRFSTRKLLIMAVCISVFSTLAFSLSTSIVLAEISRFMMGIGGSFSFLTVIVLATRWFPGTKLASIIGMIVAMAMLGGIAAQTPLTLLVDKVGWRGALWVDVAFGLVILSVIYRNVRDFPDDHAQHYHQLKEERFVLGLKKSIIIALKNKQTWLCGSYTCLLNLPILLFGAVWGINYVATVHHLSRTQASYVTSMIFIGTIIGSTIFGWMSDKLALRKLPMLIGAISSFVIVLFVLYFPGLTLMPLIILFLLLGFATSSQVISYPVIAESNSKLITGAAEGLSATLIVLAGAVFQPIFGLLMDYSQSLGKYTGHGVYGIGDYKIAILIFPIAFVISILLAFMVKETYCQSIADH